MSRDDAGSERKADDAFEAQYMPTEGAVLHRDKRVSRGLTALLGGFGIAVMGLAVLIAIMNGMGSKPLPETALPFVVGAIALLGMMLATLGVAMGVLRTVVTESEVQIKYGLWGPRIAMKDIVSCRPVAYRWTDFGGWGIRRGRNGVWAYVPSGDRAIEITYRDGSEEKRVLVGVENPEQTATIIARAAERQASGAMRTRVDVAPSAEIDAEVEAIAEAEAEAEAEALREDQSARIDPASEKIGR